MLWDVLLKQARIEAEQDATTALIVGVLVLACVYGGCKLDAWVLKERKERIDYFFGYLALGIAGVISFLVVFNCLFSAWTELYNPAYWALQEILKGGN
jgi:hypothetical protein